MEVPRLVDGGTDGQAGAVRFSDALEVPASRAGSSGVVSQDAGHLVELEWRKLLCSEYAESG